VPALKTMSAAAMRRPLLSQCVSGFRAASTKRTGLPVPAWAPASSAAPPLLHAPGGMSLLGVGVDGNGAGQRYLSGSSGYHSSMNGSGRGGGTIGGGAGGSGGGGNKRGGAGGGDKKDEGRSKMERMLQRMLEAGLPLNTRTVNTLMNSYTKRGDHVKALTTLNLMQQEGASPDARTVNMAIDTLRRVEAAQGGRRASTFAHNQVIAAFSNCGDWRGAIAWVDRMQVQGIRTDQHTFSCHQELRPGREGRGGGAAAAAHAQVGASA
jgi:pentatricopeptide repeat protein